MPQRHAFDGLARAQHRPEHIDREHALQALGAHLVEPRGVIDDASVVDQACQPGQRGIQSGEQGQHLVLSGQVGLGDDRLWSAQAQAVIGNGLCQIGACERSG